MGNPAFLLQHTIDSTNKWITVDIGGGDVHTSITEQDYSDIRAVAAALQTALQVIDGTFTCSVGITGTVTIARTGNFDMTWKTGAHGSDNADDHIGTLLGFSDAADDTGAATYDSDNQHTLGYYHWKQVEYDSRDRIRELGAPTFNPISGDATRSSWGTQYDRDVKINAIAGTDFFDSLAGTNEAFELFWQQAVRGIPFAYYSDISVPTDEGDYKFIAAANASMIDGFPRLDPAAERYSATMRLLKQI